MTKTLIFYGLALLLAVAITLTPAVSTLTYMLTPLVAVLLVMFVVTREGYTREGLTKLGVHRPGLRIWPLAVLLPAAVMTVAYLILWLSGLAGFTVPPQVQGWETNARFWLIFPGILLLSLVINTLSTSLGEELGWRGYLLPHLLKLGAVPALLVTGLLHALWHLPLILLTPLYHADGNRLIVIPLFILSVTVAGFFFGYLRLASGSVWTASLGHTAHNLAWAAFGWFTLSDGNLAVEYLAGDSGLLIALGYGAIAIWVVRRLRQQEVEARAPDSSSGALPNDFAKGGTGG